MTEPTPVRWRWSPATKVIVTLACVALALPIAACGSMLIAATPALIADQADNDDPIGDPYWYTLPACDDDAPDPSTTVPCVWNDENQFVVMDGHGNSEYYFPCVTEDSLYCVWDSAEYGNHDGDLDAPDRFVVNTGHVR